MKDSSSSKRFSKLFVVKYPILSLTLLIIFISLIVYHQFIFGDKLYLYNDVGADTINSYWPFLNLISENIDNGWSFWSFKMGIGTDMFSIGIFFQDIFNWLLFFVNNEIIVYLLPYLMILKVVIGGIIFYKYLLMTNIKSSTAILLSVYFSFNGFMMLWGQHPQFASSLVFAVLILLGFERWMQHAKWGLFCSAITLTACFSLYFLYMITIYLGLYLIFRYIEYNGLRFSGLIKFSLKTSAIYIIAILLGAVIILPNLSVMLTSPRVEGNLSSSPVLGFASPAEYVSIILRMFTTDYMGTGDAFFGYFNYYESPIIYMGLLTLILVPSLIIRQPLKSKLLYLVTFILCIFSLIYPYFSIAMNGFSTMSYRWTFIIILFGLLMAAKAMDRVDLGIVRPRIFFIISGALILIQILTIWYGKEGLDWTEQQVAGAIDKLLMVSFFIVIYTILMYFRQISMKKTWVSVVTILVVLVEVIVMSYMPVNLRSVPDRTLADRPNGYFKDEAAINYLKAIDPTIYRIEKETNNVFLNDAVMQNYFGLKSYNSLNEPSYLNLLKQLEIPLLFEHSNFIQGTDIPPILSLLSVKYYLSRSGESPLGFVKINQIEDVHIFENQYVFPFGFLYDQYSTQSATEKMTGLQRAELLMHAAVVKNEDSIDLKDIKSINPANIPSERTVTKRLELDIMQAQINDIEIDIKDDKVAKLTAQNSDPQIIFSLEPLIQTSAARIHLTIGSDSETLGQVFWANTNSESFSEEKSKTFEVKQGIHDYEIQIGKVDINSLRIDIANQPGSYTLNGAQLIYNHKLFDYEAQFRGIQGHGVEWTKFEQDSLEGILKAENPAILLLPIPFNKGWKLELDHEEKELLNVNYGLLGLQVGEGEHQIKLSYEPHLMREGILISSISLLMVFVLILKQRRKRKAIQ